MKRMLRVRRITSGLTVALLFQFGVGNSLFRCGSHRATGEHSSAPRLTAVSDSHEGHEGMPCEEMGKDSTEHSTAPTDDHDCSTPLGGSGDCGRMISCVSLLAEVSGLRASNDVLNAQGVAAVTVHAPRAVSAGPDHPPPRA